MCGIKFANENLNLAQEFCNSHDCSKALHRVCIMSPLRLDFAQVCSSLELLLEIGFRLDSVQHNRSLLLNYHQF